MTHSIFGVTMHGLHQKIKKKHLSQRSCTCMMCIILIYLVNSSVLLLDLPYAVLSGISGEKRRASERTTRGENEQAKVPIFSSIQHQPLLKIWISKLNCLKFFLSRFIFFSIDLLSLRTHAYIKSYSQIVTYFFFTYYPYLTKPIGALQFSSWWQSHCTYHQSQLVSAPVKSTTTLLISFFWRVIKFLIIISICCWME